jgi:hypothetical protein
MIYEEFNKIVKKWENVFRNKSLDLLNKDKNFDWSELENLYFQIFGKKIVKGCGNCYMDATAELSYINKKIYKDMQELRYKLMPNRLFRIGSRTWSSESIDFNNEVAEEILKVYGKGAFLEIKEMPKQVKIETEKPILEVPILEKPILEKKKVVKVAKKKNSKKSK